MRIRRILLYLILLLAVGIITIFFCDRTIRKHCEGKLYSNTTDIPFNKVGLLLGTGKYLTSGVENPYYTYRIEAAATLIKSGKIKYLVISGDNSRKDYNEPAAMRTDLVSQGIDSSVIYLDYAGFRTFDSIIRLKEIFGQDSATIISQPFHNERAIYIASQEGMTTVGFNAQDVSNRFGLKVQVREKLARTKVFIDYIFNTKPHFLGEKIHIP
jgi:SanA protein